MVLPGMISLIAIEEPGKQRWGDITWSQRRGQIDVSP
jgi:hypothetical protein